MLRSRSWWGIAVAITALVLVTLACTSPLSNSNATLVVINNTGQPLCYVYVADAAETDFGDDRLGEGNAIADSASWELEVTPGLYDLRVETCDGRPAERFDEELVGRVEWTITP